METLRYIKLKIIQDIARMPKLAAAITMVKDDYFFLEKWVTYYGEMFGRDSLYVINHGGSPKVDEIAKGCNVMHLPGDFDETFDAKRWRLLQNLANGLRSYFRFVICGDVDEYIVLDPKTGLTLPEFLSKRRKRVLITPLGLEVIHRKDVETDTISDAILGPRKYCRFSTYFCKPCIIGKPVNLARGGHYSEDSELLVFKNLYLFHMKYCDSDLFKGTLKTRSTQVQNIGDANAEDSVLSAHWFSDKGTEDELLTYLANMPISADFDFSDRLEEMNATWGPRVEGLWHFKKHVGETLFEIPERFHGII